MPPRDLQRSLFLSVLVCAILAPPNFECRAQDKANKPRIRSKSLESVPLQKRFDKASDAKLKSGFSNPRELSKPKDGEHYDLFLTTGKFNSPDVGFGSCGF